MRTDEWARSAWSAWSHDDGDEAIARCLAATGEHDDQALLLACYFAVRSQRGDALLSHLDQVERLDRGVLRDSALLLMALLQADLRRAQTLATGLADAPAQVARVTEQDDDDAIRADMMACVGMIAILFSRWIEALDAARAGRRFLAAASGEELSSGRSAAWRTRADFDLRGVEALSEFHTHSGETAQRALAEALDPLRATNRLTPNHALALICLGHLQHLRGDLSGSGGSFRLALDLAVSDRPGLAEHARVALALVWVREGRWPEASVLASSTQLPSTSSDPGWLVPQLALQALIQVIDGRRAEARDSMHLALRSNTRARSYLATAVLMHTRILLAALERDWVLLSQVVDDATEPGYRHAYRPNEWRALTVAALWQKRRFTQVRSAMTRWTREPGADQDPYYWAFAARLAQHDGDRSTAARHARRGVELLGPQHDPAGQELVRAVVAELGHGNGDDRDLPAEQPVPIAGSAPGAADLGELTPQQRRIARAVARGYTSAEIGAAMHLTKRTIDYHVMNILRVLGLDSRREIGRLLRAARQPSDSRLDSSG